MIDLHPIFVHFPIALLTLFAVLECMRFKAVAAHVDLFYSKAILVITGTIGGIISAQFGEIAEEAYKGGSQMNLLEIHSGFAGATNAVGLVITALYIGAWIHRAQITKKFPQALALCNKITTSRLMIPAALLLLVLISTTGALGGALVYGPDADPIVAFIYKLLVK